MTVPGAAEPQVTTFAYDGAGQLVAAGGGGSEVLLEWDGLGRVVGETVDGRRVESRYDCCGNRVERVGLGSRVESRYDPLGALTELEIAGHGALTLDHDAAGRELRRASAAGFVLESTWDTAGQLMRQLAAEARSDIAARANPTCPKNDHFPGGCEGCAAARAKRLQSCRGNASAIQTSAKGVAQILETGLRRCLEEYAAVEASQSTFGQPGSTRIAEPNGPKGARERL